ncbi:dihydrofolate reductase [Candidatus Saccharibacteria bacterium]|nr:dihydrofolate reductase [Candidatus Saccharibacteria bacterium]
MISVIAAVGKNLELGKAGELVFHIREDMKFFKDTTMGHPVVMGRKTFDSIGRPLPGRQNYVVTHHPELLLDGVEPVRELRQFLESVAGDTEEYFVIGGAAVYREALPYAQVLYLTEVDAVEPGADVFFPEFDKSKYTREIIKEGKEDDLAYTFAKYTLI